MLTARDDSKLDSGQVKLEGWPDDGALDAQFQRWGAALDLPLKFLAKRAKLLGAERNLKGGETLFKTNRRVDSLKQTKSGQCEDSLKRTGSGE